MTKKFIPLIVLALLITSVYGLEYIPKSEQRWDGDIRPITTLLNPNEGFFKTEFKNVANESIIINSLMVPDPYGYYGDEKNCNINETLPIFVSSGEAFSIEVLCPENIHSSEVRQDTKLVTLFYNFNYNKVSIKDNFTENSISSQVYAQLSVREIVKINDSRYTGVKQWSELDENNAVVLPVKSTETWIDTNLIYLFFIVSLIGLSIAYKKHLAKIFIFLILVLMISTHFLNGPHLSIPIIDQTINVNINIHSLILLGLSSYLLGGLMEKENLKLLIKSTFILNSTFLIAGLIFGMYALYWQRFFATAALEILILLMIFAFFSLPPIIIPATLGHIKKIPLFRIPFVIKHKEVLILLLIISLIVNSFFAVNIEVAGLKGASIGLLNVRVNNQGTLFILNSLNYDLDLHAFTYNGLHTGMDYERNIYERKIPGELSSGDLRSEEWILVPREAGETNFRVYSRPLGKFINE